MEDHYLNLLKKIKQDKFNNLTKIPLLERELNVIGKNIDHENKKFADKIEKTNKNLLKLEENNLTKSLKEKNNLFKYNIL